MDSSTLTLKYPDRQSLAGSAQRNVPVLVEALFPLLLPLVQLVGTERDLNSSPLPPPVEVLEIAAGHGHLTLALARALRQERLCTRQVVSTTLGRRRVHWTCTEGDEALLDSIRASVAREDSTAAAEEDDEEEGEQEREVCGGLQVSHKVSKGDVISMARLDIDEESDWLGLSSWNGVTSTTSAAVGGDENGVASSTSTFDLVVIANLLHIVPFTTVRTLFSRLPSALTRSSHSTRGGKVCIYGAFNEQGAFTSDGNQRFDADLRKRNVMYGLRDVQGEILPLAQENGLRLESLLRMERGNLMLVFEHARTG